MLDAAPRLRFFFVLLPFWLGQLVGMLLTQVLINLLDAVFGLQELPQVLGALLMRVPLSGQLVLTSLGIWLIGASFLLSIVGIIISYIPALRTRRTFVVLALVIGFLVPVIWDLREYYYIMQTYDEAVQDYIFQPDWFSFWDFTKFDFPQFFLVGLILAVLTYFFGPYELEKD